MRKVLSATRKKILDFINEFTDENGYPPTVREIAAAVGLASPSTVHLHIRVLRENGYLSEGGENVTRGLVLQSRRSFKAVPVLGTVRAGAPILAEEEIEGYVPFDAKNDDSYFGLNVRGDSMINAGILEGDIVIVRRQSEAENGEIVVALIGDEATVKRFSSTREGVFLLPENPAYSPIPGDRAVILGKVAALYRGIVK